MRGNRRAEHESELPHNSTVVAIELQSHALVVERNEEWHTLRHTASPLGVGYDSFPALQGSVLFPVHVSSATSTVDA